MKPARLGDVIESMKNGLYKHASQYGEDGVPCLRMYNIDAGGIVWRDIKRMRVSDEEREDYGLRAGDLLVNRVNSRELVGKTAVIPPRMEPSVFESKNIRLRLKAECARPKFINYQLLAGGRRYFAGNAQQVVGMASVSQTQLADFPIVLTDLATQDSIVAEIEKQFSRLDEAVANLKRVKANLKRYKAAVLNAAVEGRLVPTEAELARREGRSYETGAQLLQRILETRRSKWKGKGGYKEPATPERGELPEGWVSASSDAIFDFVTSGSRGWAQYYSDAGPLFLRVGNLDHQTIELDLSEVQRVMPPISPEADRSRVRSGDLLISITAELGMIAVVPEVLGEAYVNQHVAIARPTALLDRTYLGWFFACQHAGQRQLEALRRGATKAGLGLDDIRSVVVALPPLDEQHRIIAEVDRRLSLVREVETEVDANGKRAERLRQSVLQREFKTKD